MSKYTCREIWEDGFYGYMLFQNAVLICYYNTPNLNDPGEIHFYDTNLNFQFKIPTAAKKIQGVHPESVAHMYQIKIEETAKQKRDEALALQPMWLVFNGYQRQPTVTREDPKPKVEAYPVILKIDKGKVYRFRGKKGYVEL